jgi:hypothetical protein
MTTRVLSLTAVFAFVSVASSGVGYAQNFKVEKFDIKGDGGTDYVAADPATGRVYVSRGTHMMIVNGKTGAVVGDIPDTPGVHGAGIAAKADTGSRRTAATRPLRCSI